MALDTYAWLTYRLSYLTTPTVVPWRSLQSQFGSAYSRLRDFKRYFLASLAAVLAVYPKARIFEIERVEGAAVSLGNLPGKGILADLPSAENRHDGIRLQPPEKRLQVG